MAETTSHFLVYSFELEPLYVVSFALTNPLRDLSNLVICFIRKINLDHLFVNHCT